VNSVQKPRSALFVAIRRALSEKKEKGKDDMLTLCVREGKGGKKTRSLASQPIRRQNRLKKKGERKGEGKRREPPFVSKTKERKKKKDSFEFLEWLSPQAIIERGGVGLKKKKQSLEFRLQQEERRKKHADLDCFWTGRELESLDRILCHGREEKESMISRTQGREKGGQFGIWMHLGEILAEGCAATVPGGEKGRKELILLPCSPLNEGEGGLR